MTKNTNHAERLYLSKGDQIIYIDNCNIPEHPIDGIRFLYRHYKKKKPGVIINNVSGHDRYLQIVLFIKAMRHLLPKPVLLLCDEGSEHIWMKMFETLADLHDDVVVESQKPHLKKQVIINPMSNVPMFCRRDWSILIVDGESSQQVLRLPFKADYKIWVTADNMKENLDKFSQIYKWFYPKGTFDKKEFTPDKNSPSEVINKAIMLDAFFEDIVFRIDSAQDVHQEDSPPIKISRKNKDATGTKTKRSKRKIYDDDNDDDDIPLSNNKKGSDDTARTKTIKNAIPSCSTEPSNALQINDQTTDLNKENDRRKNFKEFKEHLVTEEVKMDTSNSQSQLDLYYEPDTQADDSDILYEANTLVEDEDQSSDINESVKDIVAEKNYSDDEQINNDVQNKLSPNSRDENKETVNDILSTIDDMYDKSSPILVIKSDNEDDLENSRDSPTIIDEMKTDVNEIENDRESPSICDKIMIDNLANNVLNKVSAETPSICNELVSDNVVENRVHVTLNENEKFENKLVTNEVSTSPLKRNCVEDKMKEQEEKASKKFKGSILDSLF